MAVRDLPDIYALAQGRRHICDCLCENQPSSHKILIDFLAQLIAILNSYPHSMSPMARLKRSAFLRGDLRPCKAMTDILAPVECTNWMLSTRNSTLNQNDVPSAWL